MTPETKANGFSFIHLGGKQFQLPLEEISHLLCTIAPHSSVQPIMPPLPTYAEKAALAYHMGNALK